MTDCNFEFCDFGNPDHLTALADLLNHYMEDPMGEHAPLTKLEQLRLVDGLANHPTAFVMFTCVENRFVGLVTCFELFSTFQVKPYLYIHDVILLNEYRGKGLGKRMMEKLVDYCRQMNYCKMTLEVRSDNSVAQHLYRNMGFEESKPDMYFWTKQL
jgi:ribosomal protein S18 acetylase RimI-like enzyme